MYRASDNKKCKVCFVHVRDNQNIEKQIYQLEKYCTCISLCMVCGEAIIVRIQTESNTALCASPSVAMTLRTVPSMCFHANYLGHQNECLSGERSPISCALVVDFHPCHGEIARDTAEHCSRFSSSSLQFRL